MITVFPVRGIESKDGAVESRAVITGCLLLALNFSNNVVPGRVLVLSKPLVAAIFGLGRIKQHSTVLPIHVLRRDVTTTLEVSTTVDREPTDGDLLALYNIPF